MSEKSTIYAPNKYLWKITVQVYAMARNITVTVTDKRGYITRLLWQWKRSLPVDTVKLNLFTFTRNVTLIHHLINRCCQVLTR